jgi:hypothetical protein
MDHFDEFCFYFRFGFACVHIPHTAHIRSLWEEGRNIALLGVREYNLRIYPNLGV